MESMSSLSLSDFIYDLPLERIAQHPAERREDALLLLVDKAGDDLADTRVSNLVNLLRGDELIIMNDVRVSNARLLGRKSTGGAVEVLVLNAHEQDADSALVMARSSKPLRPGGSVEFGPFTCVVDQVLGEGRFILSLPDGLRLETFLNSAGQLPLPPYIERPDGPSNDDLERYQTVFAQKSGAVAAPTAGLHFTAEALDSLQAKGCDLHTITLYVGPGTFQPVRSESIDEHRMHSEVFDIPEATVDAIRRARKEGRQVLAVGTTVVRALEGAAAFAEDGIPRAGRHETEIFIRPGFTFKVVDQLLTNFHLPGSTLLMLVSALADRRRIFNAYEHALKGTYRFFSYGDAMLIR